MTSPLTLTWPGGTLTDPTSAVTIGRDPNNTVAIDAQVISRTHGVIVWVNGGWVYRDLGSSFGSFVQGRRVQEIAVDGPMVLTLGQGEDAVPIEVRIDRPTLEDPYRGAGPVLAATAVGAQRPPVAVQGDGPARPGGALGVGRADPTLVRGDDGGPTLTVREGGRTHEVTARSGATVGRDADNTIVLDEATVSRHHLRIDNTSAGWVVADLGSGSGTWKAGARVRRLAVKGQTLLTVGDPATGPRLELQPNDAAGGARSSGRRTRRWIAVACAVVLVAAIGFGSWWFFVRDPAGLNTLAQATVSLEVSTAEGDGWGGSGTIIDAERGLILTNAHVAAPLAVGLPVQYGDFYPSGKEPADTITIAVAPGLDRAAEPRFRGELVAADGYLDTAIVKITHTLSGAPITPADLQGLVAVPLGDSDAVATGDQVTVVGYPGQAQSQAATISRGVITGSQPDNRLSSPRALFLSDAFSGAGNSGGLVANAAGEIIAVHSLSTRNPDRPSENVLGGSRPVGFAIPMIEAARSGASYVSPWATAAPDGAKITAIGFSVGGHGLGIEADCEKVEQITALPAFAVSYSGLGIADHTDVIAQLWLKTEAGWDLKAQVDAAIVYPLALPDSGCLRATVQTYMPDGQYAVDVGIGGDYGLVESWEFTYRRGN